MQADLQLVWDNAIGYYPAENELHQAAARLKQLAASTLSSLVSSLPTLDETTGSLAAFEPAIQAIEMLVSRNREEGSEQTVLTTLLSSLGNPSKPLVDALVKQGRTSTGGFSDARLILAGGAYPEVNNTPQTPKRSPEITSPIVPSTTPRARNVPVRTTPRKTPTQYQKVDTTGNSLVLQWRRQSAVKISGSTPSSPSKSPTARKQLQPLRPYPPPPPPPGEHLQDSVAANTDTASVASSSRKRKRSEYEVPNPELGDTLMQPDDEGVKQDVTSVEDPAVPSSDVSQKRSRRQTEREMKEEAKRIKREKEAERRGEYGYGTWVNRF